MSSNSLSKKYHYRDTFSILQAAHEFEFVHLDKNILIMMFDQLCKFDRNFKKVGPNSKINKDNIRNEWVSIFDNQKLEPTHVYFKQERSVDPENLIIKKYRSKEIYHRITVDNLNDITDRFKKISKPSEAEPKEVSSDEGTDLGEQYTPTASPRPRNTEKGLLSTQAGTGEAPVAKVDMKTFFRELKRDTNLKIDEQMDHLTEKFCRQLEILEEDVSEINNKCKKVQAVADKNSLKIENHEQKLEELTKKMEQMTAILNIKEDTGEDEFFDALHKPGEYRDRYFSRLVKDGTIYMPEVPRQAEQPRSVSDLDILAYEQQAEMAKKQFWNSMRNRKMGGNFKINFLNKTRFVRGNGEDIEINFTEVAKLTGCHFKLSTGPRRVFEAKNKKIFAFVQFDNDKGIIRDRYTLAHNLLDKRSSYKNELAIELSPPAHYDISRWLLVLLNTNDPETNKRIFLDFNLTKNGMYVLYLNDVTDERKIQAVRDGKNVRTDLDVASRVFITCPIAFVNLQSEFLTLEWMLKLTDRDYFIWNGQIHRKIVRPTESQ